MNQTLNPSVSLESGENEILTVWLDSANRRVNVLDAEMLEGLEAAVEHIAKVATQYRAVVIRSRKPSGFFVGADVHAIAAIDEPETLQTILSRGQQLMHRIAKLPIPTIAAIDGCCLGGGLELALACRYRVASDAPATRLGLPEIKLGVIPGWGGTQRLPKLVGIRTALKMILTGSPLDATKAHRAGLLDAVFPKDDWDVALASFAKDIAVGKLLGRRPEQPIVDRFFDHTAIGRQFVLMAARRKLGQRARDYPATTQAISAVAHAFQQSRDGYKFEREAFGELLFTPTARNLLGLFQQRDRAKRLATWLPDDAAESHQSFKKVAVVGGGAMGAGIVKLAAVKGFSVVCKEIDAPAADAARRRVEELLAVQVEKKRLSEDNRQAALARLEFTPDWEALRDCDLAIEAVLEVEEVKRDVFQSLDSELVETAVLVSNTSSLNVTRMAAATDRMDRVAGLHFFNPVDRMELVEVVCTEATDATTLARLLSFVGGLGKTPIVTSDKPGFLVNRVLFPYLGEAVRMIVEGYRADEVDREMRRFGMPMGPLELIDQVGVDIASHVAQSLTTILPEAEVPAKFLADMAGRGWLGKKSKLGFYQYEKGTRGRMNPNLSSSTPSPSILEYEFMDDGLSCVQRRLVYALLNEAVHCLDELVVTEARMVDLGMVLGTGFAPMHGGPLRLIDSLGLQTVQHNLSGLASEHGERFLPADGIRRRQQGGELFFSAQSLVDKSLEIPSELKSNAISG